MRNLPSAPFMVQTRDELCSNFCQNALPYKATFFNYLKKRKFNFVRKIKFNLDI